MKTPEEWSREIYDKCHSPVSGRASVKPAFVAGIQADARRELLEALADIRDMPEYDQDDAHRLRNKARIILDSQNDKAEAPSLSEADPPAAGSGPF